MPAPVDANPFQDLQPPAGPELAGADVSPLSFSRLFREQVDFVTRYLRRLGIPEHLVEDAAQKVFLVASSKLELIRSGAERSFLVGTAHRVAADVRDQLSRRRELPVEDI